MGLSFSRSLPCFENFGLLEIKKPDSEVALTRRPKESGFLQSNISNPAAQ